MDLPLPPPSMVPVPRPELVSRIGAALADNNNQGISAEDIRSRLYEIVASFAVTGETEGGIDPRAHGAVGDGNPANMAVDTHGWQQAIDLSASSGLPVMAPPGVFIIDGYKGDHAAWSAGDLSKHGGLVLAPGARIRGAGVGVTVLRNGADQWRSVIRIRSGTASITDLTIDGDVDNHHPVLLGTGDEDATHGSVRGEGIILEGDGHVDRFQLMRLEVKNTGHYGIGIQNVAVDSGLIEDVFFANIGGDCIDGKDYTTGNYKRNIYIRNVSTNDGCGHNYTGKYAVGEGHNNQTCVDMCGGMHLHGAFIRGLDSYSTQIGNCGVRGRAQQDSSFRSGSKGCTATLIRIESAKLANEGGSSLKRIIGIEQGDDDFHVADAVVKKCYLGVRVLDATAESVPLSGSFTDLTIEDCKGAGTAGQEAYGLSIASAVRGIFGRNIKIRRCERGARLAGQDCDINLRIEDSVEIQLEASDGALQNNNVQASFGRAHTTPSIGDFDPSIAPLTANDQVAGLSPKGTLLRGDLSVIKPRRGFLNILATANDSGWTGADAALGGLQAWSGDDSGPPPPMLRAAIWAEMTNSAGGGGTWWRFMVTSSTALVEAMIMTDASISCFVPLRLQNIAKASLPAAAAAGNMAYVTDEAGGAVPAFSDGTNWRRVTDRAIVT